MLSGVGFGLSTIPKVYEIDDPVVVSPDNPLEAGLGTLVTVMYGE